MECWDPIGISDQVACRDEYDRYIGGAIGLLLRKGTDEDLAEYLRRITQEQMKLSPDEHAIAKTVKVLRQIRLV